MSAYYEGQRAAAEYLLFHYGTAEQILPFPFGPHEALDFPSRCVREAISGLSFPSNARALDLGCAVGRASFELARTLGEVVAIDFSARFIELARQLQRDGAIEIDRIDEGDQTTRCRLTVPEEIERTRVRFERGDAQNLPPNLDAFDLVFAANLIDRLPRPADFLRRCQSLVKADGFLFLASPYTWLEEYTPRTEWVGGRSGSTQETRDAIAAHLGEAFTLQRRTDLPFLLREHARKYQWSVAEATVWKRA